MFPVIHLGPLTIQARGLILLAAFWLAAEAAERGAKRLGLRGDVVYSLAFIAAAAGLIGARLGYVLEHWSAYQSDLGAIVALNFNTLSPLAGIVTGVIAAYWYARRKGVANRKLLDALTPGFIVFAGGLALADAGERRCLRIAVVAAVGDRVVGRRPASHADLSTDRRDRDRPDRAEDSAGF